MARKLQAAHIPLILMAIPSRSEAALMQTKQKLPHTDPFTFDRRIGDIASHAGASFVDAVQAFNQVPGCDRFFYVVDTHINAEGDKVIAKALERKCLDGIIPALNAQKTPRGTLHGSLTDQ
jgi:hypothetical protein